MKVFLKNDENLLLGLAPVSSHDEILLVAIINAFIKGGDIYVRSKGVNVKYTATPPDPSRVAPELVEFTK